MRHLPASTICDRLWIPAVAVRLVVVGLLVFGPWTDEPAELEGWDAQRFQQIASRDGAAWVDEPVEYPPGSVVVFDRLAGEDVVSTNRRLIVVSAVLEAIGVTLLWRRAGPMAAKAFLVLGLPLVPMGLMRLDMAVTVVAIGAAILLLSSSETDSGSRRAVTGGGFAALVAVGAMIKIWPALLVAAAWAVGRKAAAAAALATTAVLGFGWLIVVGNGLEPLDQVLSLRGATGWHVESLPGSPIALIGDAEPRLELNAYRIGDLNRAVVTGGRVLAVAAILALVATAGRIRSGPDSRAGVLALVMLGSTASLLITAPLLSPQFLLWLTPWGALAIADRQARRADLVIGCLIVAVALTGLALTLFRPPDLGSTAPALILAVRNLALLVLPPACLIRLRSMDGPPSA